MGDAMRDKPVRIRTRTITANGKSYTLGFCPICGLGVSGSASVRRAVAGVGTHMRAKHSRAKGRGKP
jgi:hypothetical protein